MIPSGLANALFAWAYGIQTRIDTLKGERDAIVQSMISGGQPTSILTSSSFNGSSFTWQPGMTIEDKLTILTETLRQLGALDAATSQVNLTYASFDRIQR